MVFPLFSFHYSSLVSSFCGQKILVLFQYVEIYRGSFYGPAFWCIWRASHIPEEGVVGARWQFCTSVGPSGVQCGSGPWPHTALPHGCYTQKGLVMSPSIAVKPLTSPQQDVPLILPGILLVFGDLLLVARMLIIIALCDGRTSYQCVMSSFVSRTPEC